MRIGELAKKAACSVETVRYYETEGLLQAAGRTGSNYRQYGPAHLERLAFILRCRSLDMSLPEIRSLLTAMERPDSDCAPVDALLSDHIEHITARIADLRQLKGELVAIRSHCAGEAPAKNCGILASLKTGKPAVRAAPRSHVQSTHKSRRNRLR